MFLAVDKEEPASTQLDLAILRWEYRAPSVFLHHGKACCEVAREWTIGTDYSQLNGEHELTGPRWIRARYKWGPSKWPLSWCEAVEKKTLDCGALSAMSREVFTERGLTCYPAQLIQTYSQQSGTHWSANWNAGEALSDWVVNELTYHETCAVVIDGNVLKIWDPTAACWVSPPKYHGYGSVLAVRVMVWPTQSMMMLRWGTIEIELNQWRKTKLTSDSAVSGYEAEPINIALENQLSQVRSYSFESSAGGD